MNTHYRLRVDCRDVLGLDKSIRFAGIIRDRQVVSFAKRPGIQAMLDCEYGNMAHHQASVRASMEEMFDEDLGRTNWMITSKEYVKMITVFFDDEMLIFSTDADSDHDRIIKSIQKLGAGGSEDGPGRREVVS